MELRKKKTLFYIVITVLFVAAFLLYIQIFSNIPNYIVVGGSEYYPVSVKVDPELVGKSIGTAVKRPFIIKNDFSSTYLET